MITFTILSLSVSSLSMGGTTLTLGDYLGYVIDGLISFTYTNAQTWYFQVISLPGESRQKQGNLIAPSAKLSHSMDGTSPQSDHLCNEMPRALNQPAERARTH